MMNASPNVFMGHVLASIILCAVSVAQTGPVAPSDSGPPPLSGMKYDHVSISVQDMDREVEWYSRVLGFKETNRTNRAAMLNVNMQNGNMRIDLIKYLGSKRTPADPVYMAQGWAHVAVTVPDIPAALAALRALNADVKRMGGSALTLRDPEGNELEVFPESPAAP